MTTQKIPELDPETKERIEQALERFANDPNSLERRRFEAAQAEMDERFRPMMEAIDRSMDVDRTIVVY